MSLLKRNRPEPPSPQPEPAPVKPGGKGRPTPKRKDAQARRVRPVVPADRKAAKREARAARDKAFKRQQEAMITGEDRWLPPRDKGPIKRYIRDYIDARYCVGEVFMPLTLVLIVLMMISSWWTNPSGLYLLLAVYGVFFLAMGDALVCWLRLRRLLRARFGQDRVRDQGPIFFYVLARCMQLRRWRRPAALVERKEFPS
ncbi:DUF3043 domain-containing protein [Actinomyces bowdenii]|uniref:DUF3043 domain-containing protein n=1 Tax=Actinomyces bowdenii TaxID=131109 RepID=A0A3P1V544_9ACTO|nr:DUF3043 domain-containing protein [Actinomyces bowdenii]RRD29251.1 DUF3043 domain-containing protein [Actinomyces bowdenii]